MAIKAVQLNDGVFENIALADLVQDSEYPVSSGAVYNAINSSTEVYNGTDTPPSDINYKIWLKPSGNSTQILTKTVEGAWRAVASVSGVQVGSGEMMEGYNVQVDPTGESYQVLTSSPDALATSTLTTEDQLNSVLEAMYSTMGNSETRLVRFNGFPSNSDYNFYGLLSRSTSGYGSLIAHSAYNNGSIFIKGKHGGTWRAGRVI